MTDPNLSDDTEGFVPTDHDMDDDGGLYVDFSGKEAASESRDPEPLPTGKYLCTITDVELRESKSEDNFGKPMYNFEFAVVDALDPQYITDPARKCWSLAMLWSPALFTIVNIMKALDFPVQEGRSKVPAPGAFIGKTVVVGGKLMPKRVDKKDPSKVYDPRFEPKGYWHEKTWADVKAGRAPSAGTMSAKRSSSESLLR